MPDETTRTEIMGEPGILRVEMQQERRNLTAKLLEASAPYLKATNGVFMISTLYRDSREVLVRGSLFLNPSNTYSNGANLQGYHTEDEAAAEFARIRAAIAHYCAEWKRKMNGVMVEVDPSREFNAAPQTDNPSAESDGAFAIRMWRDLFGRIEIGRLGAMVELQPGGGPPLDDALRLAQLVKGAPHA